MKQLLKTILAVYRTRRIGRRQFSTEELESRHTEKGTRLFSESKYFAGISRDGFCFVTRQTYPAGKSNENWMMISIPGEGVWSSVNRGISETKGFKQGSLEYKCIQPGEAWRVGFSGLLTRGDAPAEFSMDLEWKGIAPLVLADKIGSTPLQIGKQIAEETWNFSFFSKLKELDMVRYEQAGTMKGLMNWKGKKHDMEFIGLRYHTWGLINWNHRDRHYRMLGLLEDGRFFHFSLINYTFVKNIQTAFLYDGNKYKRIYSIPGFKALSLESLMPESLSFPVWENRNGKHKLLKANMLNFFPFNMDNKYYVRQAETVFEYDGVKGLGIAEMGVNSERYEFDIGD